MIAEGCWGAGDGERKKQTGVYVVFLTYTQEKYYQDLGSTASVAPAFSSLGDVIPVMLLALPQ